MKKIIGIVLIIILMMIFEFQVIMANLRPYLGENNTVYVECFGRVDKYYAERVGGDTK